MSLGWSSDSRQPELALVILVTASTVRPGWAGRPATGNRAMLSIVVGLGVTWLAKTNSWNAL